MVGLRKALCILWIMPALAAAQEAPTGSWSPRASYTTTSWEGAHGSDGQYLYMAGGNGCSQLTRRYNPVTDSWTNLASIPQQLFFNRGALFGGTLFSFSGEGPPAPVGITYSRPVWKYSIAGDSWTVSATQVPSVLTSTGGVAGVIGDKIYLFAGGGATVYEFDPIAETFTTRAALPFARSSIGGAILNSKMYIFGGSATVDGVLTILAEAYEYDPATDAWTRKADMTVDGSPAPRRYFSAFALNNRIFIPGGMVLGATLAVTANCLEYNPVADNYVRRADLGKGRMMHSAQVVGTRAFVVGGGSPTDATVGPTCEEFSAPDFGLPPVIAQVRQLDLGADLSQGGVTNSVHITFSADVTDPNAGQDVAFEVQLKPVATPTWDGLPVLTTGLNPQGVLTITTVIPGLGAYDWRYRAVDSFGNQTPGGAWMEFNNNAVSPDFTFQAPPAPTPDPGSNGSDNGKHGGCMAGDGSGNLIPMLVALAILMYRKSKA